jgi:hypothetical protein
MMNFIIVISRNYYYYYGDQLKGDQIIKVSSMHRSTGNAQ